MKIGDAVKLKSGGPSMTIIDRVRRDIFQCSWFEGPFLHSGEFSEQSLVLVNDTLNSVI